MVFTVGCLNGFQFIALASNVLNFMNVYLINSSDANLRKLLK